MAVTNDQTKKPVLDLGATRAHVGASAASASAGMGASAYTAKDVHFGAGSFAPGAGAGGGLMAHEAAHVVQQPAGIADINAAVGHYAR